MQNPLRATDSYNYLIFWDKLSHPPMQDSNTLDWRKTVKIQDPVQVQQFPGKSDKIGLKKLKMFAPLQQIIQIEITSQYYKKFYCASFG
jgi:hypothetical protein